MAIAFAPIQRVTAEALDHFVEQPHNADKLFELINGEVVEVPSNPQSSAYSQVVAGEFYIFLRGKDIAHLTGEAGGYIIAGERYAPDVAIVLKARQVYSGCAEAGIWYQRCVGMRRCATRFSPACRINFFLRLAH
jgi:Uma2 family endonuclease